MIDWGFYGELTTVTIACIAIAAVIVKRARERYRPALTVEQEQAESRQVIACIGQHHPSEPEEYQSLDDPILMMVHEMMPRTK